MDMITDTVMCLSVVCPFAILIVNLYAAPARHCCNLLDESDLICAKVENFY